MYADNLVFLAEDRVITDAVAKFNWDPKIPFDQFDARSINNARNARESQVYRDKFLASIRDRLGTAAVKGQALDLCQELFLADGGRSDEEDAVLQNLRKLLESIPSRSPSFLKSAIANSYDPFQKQGRAVPSQRSRQADRVR